MAKVQIKSENLTPFGGIYSIMEQFEALLAQIIDFTLGLCTLLGYQYSEILHSHMYVYLCGGSCVEEVSTHLILRGAPLVSNTTFMGICVDNPRRFKAYAPIGTIFALSRLAIAWAMYSTDG